MILPYKRHIPSLSQLTAGEKADLGLTIGATSRRLDNLFECSFGYTMGVYQSPTHTVSYFPSPFAFSSDPPPAKNDAFEDYAQLFISFYPPLLRSSTVKKFLVGFELFAETQRDITPEQAAERLRKCGDVHYKLK